MIQLKFKNLKRSDFLAQSVHDRFQPLIDKFDDLKESPIKIVLEMENSPIQVGPDFFKVKLYISQGRFAGIKVEKSNSNLYVAIAEVVDHMLEVLNRFGDRERVKQIKKARQIIRKINHESDLDEPI